MIDGSTVEIPVDEIDSITFSMTNPFNFETKTVKLNSGYEMPIIGIGTYLLSTDRVGAHLHSRKCHVGLCVSCLRLGLNDLVLNGDDLSHQTVEVDFQSGVPLACDHQPAIIGILRV